MKLFLNKAGGHKKKGVALLIALLISSVALAVGVGVYNRSYKELVISSFWKQAQIAFSAADAGLECAMYWDKNKTPSPTCFNGPLGTWNPTQNLPLASFSDIPVGDGCVSVTIEKGLATDGVTTITTIKSRGRNTCSSNVLRLVERAVGVQY